MQTLQWLCALGPVVCPWDSVEIAKEAVHLGALNVVAWLRLDVAAISQAALQPIIDKELLQRLIDVDNDACRMLHSELGAQLPCDNAVGLVDLLDSCQYGGPYFNTLVPQLLLAVQELSIPWGAWTSQDCRRLMESVGRVFDIDRDAWQKLHESTCPCTCSVSDIDEYEEAR